MITAGAPAKRAAAGCDSTVLTAADCNHVDFEPGHHTWIHLVVDTGSAPANHPVPRERRKPQSLSSAEGRWLGTEPMLCSKDATRIQIRQCH